MRRRVKRFCKDNLRVSAVYAHALEVGANGTFDLHEQIFAADVATADTDGEVEDSETTQTYEGVVC